MQTDLPQGKLKILEQFKIPFTVVKPVNENITDMVRVEVADEKKCRIKLRAVKSDLDFLNNAFDNGKQTA